jgi:GNAT superfamily N-acetyltransferase
VLDTVTIRSAVPADAESIVGLRRVVYPYLVISTAEIRRDLAEPVPARQAAEWVATGSDDGDVVGAAICGINIWTSEPGIAYAAVVVHPDRRRQGIGTALLDHVIDHLTAVGATRIQSFVQDSSAAFARRSGFDQNRELHYVGTELRSLPPQPPTPPGITLVSAAEAGPELMYAVDTAATLDEPSDSPSDAIDYDDWLRSIWTAPSQRNDLSIAALADGKAVAFTAIQADGDRAWSGMTGTLRDCRGRGLAKLVKSVALRRAAGAGIRTAATSMDDRNGPMRAINKWLGYRPVATHLGMTRTLDPALR